MSTLTTESVNPDTRHIDRCGTLEILTHINREDHTVADAVQRVLPQIRDAVELVVRSLKNDGRLIYIGAGTSGRIGVIDAVECLPTYGVPEDKILAVIAGGETSMCRAQEDAEDDEEAGRRAMERLHAASSDTVIGLSASGSTPFVTGALREAKARGASAVAIVCNGTGKNLDCADIGIRLITGPEVIAGSTRMKAATAEKMTVNMISTASMIRLGKVMGNFMVEIHPRNTKLRKRACFIVSQLCNMNEEEAKILLEHNAWNLRASIAAYEANAQTFSAGS